MAKRHSLVDSSTPMPSKKPCITDWKLCVLCQKATKSGLECPARSSKAPIGSGYKTLAEHLIQFQMHGYMPPDIDIKRLDDGDGIEATMMRHRACWHKACRVKFSQTKLERLEKRLTDVKNEGATPLPMHTRSNQESIELNEDRCFFCDETAGSARLHNASTYDIDRKVRKCALELEDTSLIAKLAPGDMIALEAKYHGRCLVALYNRARHATTMLVNEDHNDLHGIAFAELVAYMEDFRMEGSVAPVFKLADLAHLYKLRLEQLGVVLEGRVHTSRLKLRLLSVFPDLRSHLQGRKVMLSFDDDIGDALKKACYHDSDNDAIHLARAAKVVRKEMFSQTFSFNGTFSEESLLNAVPQSLLALVNMILEGPNIKHQTQLDTTAKKIASNSISQLLMFNSVKHTRAVDSSPTVRHSSERETPITVYIALKIHAVTRSRNLIDALFNLGMCISYDRLLNMTSDISNAICEQFRVDGIVCPPKLRYGIFTTAAVDNIDYNPTSATAKDSFHGTGISLFQHRSSISEGYDRGVQIISQSASNASRSVVPLPAHYTNVPPASMKTKEFTAPAVDSPIRPITLLNLDKGETEWLNKVMAALTKDNLDGMDWISWSAHHASIQITEMPPAAINALLPLFIDSAHSAAMIKHSMTIVQAAVRHLNPGQVPILTADQPLFALAKQIQWTWPNQFGESLFVIMFGGLHIEMAILKVLGDWLNGSGWISALVQANIASTGTADSFISVRHVTKTRHVHQVTAASLHILMHSAFAEYESEDTGVLSLEQWCELRTQQSVHFYYWLKTLALETLMLLYVRSLREGNFQLYLESLTKIVPWMFALDHTHYSRWLPIHLRDMTLLSENHPEIYDEFCAGKFVVHKTSNKFSAMAIDQCHEQNNAVIKESGGAVGLMTNPGALRRWMVAGPEVVRMVNEFEALQSCDQVTDHKHHEQYPGVQTSFLKEVKSLVAVIEEMGNPFLEQSKDLLVLDTRDILDPSVGESVLKAEKLGEKQYHNFVEERLSKCMKPITDVIHKNKLVLHPPLKPPSKQKMQVTALKNDCNLFSRLYISCQTRSGDLETFFMHENQAAPPSLSLGGKLRLGTKADLLDCLGLEEIQSTNTPSVDAKLLDGAAIVQMLNPGTARTFQEYSDLVFLSYVSNQLTTAKRVDIVWDAYISDSLKGTTRQKRGKGIRRRVAPSTQIPKNWKDFLRVDENKVELFKFLSQQAIRLPIDERKVIYATDGRNVLTTMDNAVLTNLSPCLHEEADTRLLLHAADAVKKGHRKLCVRTVDTDVVVIAIAMFNQINPDELWLAFGTGSNFRYIPIHEAVSGMDPRKIAVLPVFHAFTGCDTVSSFGGRGKKTAWKIWQVYPDVTEAFKSLLLMEDCTSDSVMSVLEQFVVLLYDRTSDQVSVNDARKKLFTQKSRSLENLPPTQAALVQHTKRASYQANCWNRALCLDPSLPSPIDWGWQKDDAGWQPLWTSLPEASESCHELIHCGCKKGCRGRCKCLKAALKCTALCACSGTC